MVAAHLGLFDDVIRTIPSRNIKGDAKLQAIPEMAQGPFEYLGGSNADIPIWRVAEKSGFVSPSPSARCEMERSADPVGFQLDKKMTPAAALIKGMRLHQSAKNVLVFVTVLFAHDYMHFDVLVADILDFVCFSLCASGVYLINDIADIQADRKHATKHKRPFAAGHLSIRQGLIATAVLLGGAILASFLLVNILFGLVLTGYAILTTAYTF